MTLARRAVIAVVRGYQWLVSPLLGASCRFQPTCSQYCIDAIAAHGVVRGGWLTLKRLGRCHPWGGSGFDPVPGRPTRGEDAKHSP